jgi:hypothetical protein
MSLLQEVIEQYGDSENAKAPTAKTAKTSKRPAKWGSVSFGSEWSELLENAKGELTECELPIASDMVAIMEMREKGLAPDHYTSTTTCKHCGPVPIWEGCPLEVNGCPWCFNRRKNQPIPSTIIKSLK